MIRPTASNLTYIQRLADRGLSPNQIAVRCQERLVWHGPLPHADDIRQLLEHQNLVNKDAREAAMKMINAAGRVSGAASNAGAGRPALSEDGA